MLDPLLPSPSPLLKIAHKLAALFTAAGAAAATAFDNFSPRRRRQQTSAIGHELLIKTHFNRTKTIILCLPF